MRTSPVSATIRQGLVGLVLVVLSLPLLWALSRAVGLGSPPMGGVLLLGGSAVVAWACGGALGNFIGRGARGGRSVSSPAIAALCGLVLGGVACSVVAPFYAQSVVESVAREAASDVWKRRDELIEKARAAATQAAQDAARNPAKAAEQTRNAENLKSQAARLGETARTTSEATAGEAFSSAKTLALSAAARLPALTLLFWTLFGPAIAAFIEARRAAR